MSIIRKDQNKEGNLKALEALLIEGELSGVSHRSITEIWDEAEEKYTGDN